jgi:anti-sigma factor RsiW
MTTAPKPDDTLLVHAYADGELDPANALALERRIAAEPALAEELKRVEALRQTLRERLPREAPPPHLRARIEAQVGLSRRSAPPSWRALAASAVLAAVIGSGATWLVVGSSPTDTVAEAVAANHMRALLAAQATDVTSTDRHTVKPWFNSRIAQAPRVVDLSAEGFPLVGGRVDVIGRRPVPTLVYRHRQHLISVTALPVSEGAAALRAPKTIEGYGLQHWVDDGVAYWVASDLGAKDLDSFVKAFRTANPDR